MRTTHRFRQRVVALLVAALLAATGCAGDGGSPAGDAIDVVVTTTIWGDAVRNIVGDAGSVEVLMPVGADPHAYQASSRQAARIQTADVVVANGLGLEEGLADVIDAARSDGVTVVEMGPMLDPIPLAAGSSHGDEEHDGDDPHVWMDPVRTAEGVRLIGEELEQADPGRGHMARADAYIVELEGLHADLLADFAGLSEGGRKMVTNHEAFGYFADRYGFVVVGVVIPGGSTLADPSSADLSALVAAMRNEDVTTIYTETTEPSTLADAVASELGESVSVVELFTGSLGNADEGAATYVEMMRTNAARIVDADT